MSTTGKGWDATVVVTPCKCGRPLVPSRSDDMICTGCRSTEVDSCTCGDVRATASTCAGCGEQLRLRNYATGTSGRTYVSIWLAPGVEVYVCAARNGRADDYPREKCALAARASFGLCPGCGKYMGTNHLLRTGTCEQCDTTLERMAQLQDRPVRWRALVPAQWFGWYEKDGSGKLADALLRQLAQALAVGMRRYRDGKGTSCSPVPSDRRDGSSYDAPQVELDDVQAEHLAEVAGLLHQLVESVKRDGVASGSNLLQRLAQGEVTVDDFEDRRSQAVAEVPTWNRHCYHCTRQSNHTKEQHLHAIAEIAVAAVERLEQHPETDQG